MNDETELRRIIAAHELKIQQLTRELRERTDEVARLRSDNTDLFVFHVDNVLPLPEWAQTHGGNISNSAALSLVRNGDITSVQKGRHHLIVLTEHTLAYRKGNRGPRSTRPTTQPKPDAHS